MFRVNEGESMDPAPEPGRIVPLDHRATPGFT